MEIFWFHFFSFLFLPPNSEIQWIQKTHTSRWPASSETHSLPVILYQNHSQGVKPCSASGCPRCLFLQEEIRSVSTAPNCRWKHRENDNVLGLMYYYYHPYKGCCEFFSCSIMAVFYVLKTNNPNKNLTKDLNRHFSKEDTQRAHRHEKCSTSLDIREMQIKATVRYHFTLVRMVIITKSTNNKCWQGCGEKRPLVLLVRMQTGAATVENSMEFPQKTEDGTAFWCSDSTAGNIA